MNELRITTSTTTTTAATNHDNSRASLVNTITSDKICLSLKKKKKKREGKMDLYGGVSETRKKAGFK